MSLDWKWSSWIVTLLENTHDYTMSWRDPACLTWWCHHYNDVIMGAIASQSTSPTIVYSIVYSDADQRKHQSSASVAFVRGIHRGSVNSPHKWPVTRKMFPFDDVIMMANYYHVPGPSCGESISDHWAPFKNGQWYGKCFLLMTSSREEMPNEIGHFIWQLYQFHHLPQNSTVALLKCYWWNTLHA